MSGDIRHHTVDDRRKVLSGLAGLLVVELSILGLCSFLKFHPCLLDSLHPGLSLIRVETVVHGGLENSLTDALKEFFHIERTVTPLGALVLGIVVYSPLALEIRLCVVAPVTLNTVCCPIAL